MTVDKKNESSFDASRELLAARYGQVNRQDGETII